MTSKKPCKMSKWIGKLLIVAAILIFAILFFSHKFYGNNVVNQQGYQTVATKEKTQDELYADYFILRKNKINPFSVNFTLLQINICDGRTYLLIIVPSKLQNLRQRRAIRSTWTMMSDTRVKHIFLVGQSFNTTLNELIIQESKLYKDIIQGDFVDTYFNLTMKILMGLKWTHLYCYNASFILKADDDTFVNTVDVIHTLQTNTSLDYRGLIIGNLNKEGKVKRSGLWKVELSVYPFPHYPQYMFGNTYVISRNIADRLVKASEHMPYIPIEDAYITGILAKSIRTVHQHVRGFTFWYDVPPTACDFINSRRVTATKVSPQMMEYMWRKLNSEFPDC